MPKIVRIISYVLMALAIIAACVLFVLSQKNEGDIEKAEESLKQSEARYTQLLEEKKTVQSSVATVEEPQIPSDAWTVVSNELPVYSLDDIGLNVDAADGKTDEENAEQSKLLTVLRKGDDVTLIDENDKANLSRYIKIGLPDGNTGYVWGDALIPKSEFSEGRMISRVIVIDPGHQGQGDNEKEPLGPKSSEMKARVSSGTQGVSSGKTESQLTLDIALQLETTLENKGYTVVLIRRSEDVSISNRERAYIANDLKADAFLRIHADGEDSKASSGFHTICSSEKNANSDTVPYEKSKELANCIMESYKASTELPSIYDKANERDDLSGINWSKVPVTIIELGFMTNADEDAKLTNPDFQAKMVEGIANGFDAYFYSPE